MNLPLISTLVLSKDYDIKDTMPTLNIELLTRFDSEGRDPARIPVEFVERMPMFLEAHVRPNAWTSFCIELNQEMVTLHDSRKTLSFRKFLLKVFTLVSVLISAVGIGLLVTSVDVRLPVLILYIIILWLLITILFVMPILVPMVHLKKGYQAKQAAIDRLCRRYSRQYENVKFKIYYDQDRIFLKLLISTSDDNLDAEIVDSERSSESSVGAHYMDIDKIEKQEVTSCVLTAGNTETSKSREGGNSETSRSCACTNHTTKS